jgi:hypothetical protein
LTDNFNDFKAKLRTQVLASSTVTNLIGQRFLGAEIATMRDVVFPMATFITLAGEEHIVLQTFDMTIKTFSDKHYDEAHNVYSAIRDTLYNTLINSDLAIIRPVSNPVDTFDEGSRLFSVNARYRVHRII